MFNTLFKTKLETQRIVTLEANHPIVEWIVNNKEFIMNKDSHEILDIVNKEFDENIRINEMNKAIKTVHTNMYLQFTTRNKGPSRIWREEK